ncbi:nitrate- and nitrite sensing domain-containing protein [Nocardia sp. CA-135398]|uniref:sensor histidine kinase n=1 Tax=Nocardia sp. CA-135398 TaxID=3239977 RepID=UPI003D98121D
MRPRTIKGQLARILVVSLVLVLALLGLTVAREVEAFRDSGDTVHAVSLALVVQDLVQEAQRERGLSNGLLGGDIRLVQAVADQRVQTNRALAAAEAAAAGNAPGADRVRSAIGQFDALDATRTQIDARRTSRQAAFQFYTDGISALNRLTLGLDRARDAEVRHGLEALYALGEAKEQTAKERGFLNGVFAADEFRNGEYVEFLDIRAAKMAGLTAFARDATAAQQARLDDALRSENAIRAGESERIAIASSAGPLVRPVDPSTWWAQMTTVIDEQRTVQQAVGDDVQRRAAALRRDAFLTLGGFLLAALIAIAAEVALVYASVRAIVRPLAELAAEADDVANHRLPGVIAAWRESDDTQPDPPAAVRTPRGASVEIAAVAGALDGVQTTAFELASEQALVRRNTTESMANLARRNQNLVRRQLGLISEFEREELDPKALSNLFELDHLATRMRRNAESLLVLVGAGSPRRWAEPIALTDVIRAGLSEVDDYRRVVLRRVDDIAITGAVVSDLAHMLAELIENGLAFSPPDMEVEIYGRKLPTGYLLAVVDHGVGMPVAQLDEANARLRGETDFVVAPTRYLGHYVVGRLARRLGIDVELNVSPVSGIVARLLLPAGIIAGEKDRRAPGDRRETAAGSPGVVPGAQDPAESAAGRLVGDSKGFLAREAVSARSMLDSPRHGAPVTAAPINGDRVHGAPVNGAPIDSGPINGAPGRAPLTGAPVSRGPDGASNGGHSVSGTPIGDSRVIGAPVGGAADGAPVGGVAVNGSPVVGPAEVKDAPVRGTPVGGSLGASLTAEAGASGSPVGSAGVNDVPVGGVAVNGAPVDGVALNDAPIGGAPTSGAPAPDAPMHHARMTGGSDPDGSGPRQSRSGGPAHSRPGFASPTSVPFAHFLSTPDDSGDGVVSTASGREGAMPIGDLAAPEKMGPARGDGAVSTGDMAASKMTHPPRGNGAVPVGGMAASEMTHPPRGDSAESTGDMVASEMTRPSRGNGTANDEANRSLTGLPSVNGSDHPADGTLTAGGPLPAASSASDSLWQIPESATAAPESAAAGVQRTRNGLVKRNKRARAAGSDSAPRVLTPHPPSAPAVERSPVEIRSMLAAFRAGHERGTSAPPRAETNENIPSVTDLAQTSASPTTAEEIR